MSSATHSPKSRSQSDFISPRYHIQRELGSGGMGRVYLARDRLEDDRPVALKICHPRIAPSNIQREFRILRELRHPGIARAYDLGRIPRSGATYFTMEHVPGRDLGQRSEKLRRTRDGQEILLIIFHRIAEILSHLHSKGLLHLDLKPSNIVVGDARAGEVKIIDFGLFQNLSAKDFHGLRGTIHYMAPEVSGGHGVDERTDLYSLGVTFYRAYTGRFPIAGRSVEEVIANSRNEAPIPTELLPEAVGRVVMKLLARSPERRFQKAAEVAAALAPLLRSAAPPADRGRPAAASNLPRAALSPAVLLQEEPDFAGREREIERAFTWIEGQRHADPAADTGPGRFLLVEGEIGSGKSRLLEAITTELLIEGFPVVRLRNLEGPEGGGIRRLVEKLLVLRPLRGPLRERFAFLLARLGILSTSEKHRRETALLEGAQIQERVLTDVKELLELALQAGSLVLLIDDLQAADEDFLALLRRLIEDPVAPAGADASSPPAAPADPRLARARLLVAAALRTEREFFDRVFPAGAPPSMPRIRLAPLTPAASRQALARFLPVLGAGPVSAIIHRSRGNPFLLARFLHAALQGDELPEGLHEDLERILLQRVASWSGPKRSVLELLALLGGSSPAEELRAASGLSPSAFQEARLALALAGFTREEGRTIYLLHHGIERKIIERIPHEALTSAHARLGRFLARDPRRLPEASRHLLSGGIREEGLELAEKAIRSLRAAGRTEEALRLGELAAGKLTAAETGFARWEELRADLAESCGRFDQAGERFAALAAIPGTPPAARLRLLRKRGAVLQRMGQTVEARRILEDALALGEAAPDTHERLHVLNELASLRLFERDFPGATTFANRGLEILESPAARGLPRESRATHALNLHSIAGHIALRQFEYERSVEEFERGLRHARELGTLSNEALILNNLGIALNQSNRLADALRIYGQAARIARRTGDRNALFSIICNLVGIRSRRGELQAAGELLAEARAMPLAERSKRARLFLLLADGLLARTALVESERAWRECIEICDALPDPLYGRWSRVHLLENEIAAGRWQRAREILRELERIEEPDLRFARAVAARGAFLDSISGREADARERLRRAGGEAPRPERYSDQWDAVWIASAHLELEENAAAVEILKRERALFERTGQLPGVLECALLLADEALRRRDAGEARIWILEARAALRKHDHPAGSRGARLRLPLIEARAALLAPRLDPARVADRLLDAAGNLGPVLSGESSWLIRLLEQASGRASAAVVARARRRFVEGLAEEDRKAYLGRDHPRRLGLRPEGGRPAEPGGAAASGAIHAAARYHAIAELGGAPDAERALRILCGTSGARAGAILVKDEVIAQQGIPRRERARVEARLRSALVRGAAASPPPGPHPHPHSPPGGPREEEGRKGGFLTSISIRGRIAGSVLLENLSAEPPEDAEEFIRLAMGVWLGSRSLGNLPTPSPGGTLDIGAAGVPPSGEGKGEAEADSSAATRTFSTPRFHLGSSRAMQELATMIQRTRESDLPVLILGESGTGKEMVARAIHALSGRRDRPFIAQSCAAIPEALLEADLFGYKRGAFSSADQSRSGFLFSAQGGTFFLDGVESLAAGTQAKLLRTLETKEVRPLGGDEGRKFDIRFIASSQRDLKDEADRGLFRRDLYFRMAGISLRVPPLRERAEDIPTLIEQFLRDSTGPAFNFTPAALKILQSHPWPGNVRELESFIRRLSIMGLREVGAAEVTRLLGLDRPGTTFPRWLFEGKAYQEVVEQIKREYLIHLCERFAGDLDRVAAELGTSKRNLYLRLAGLGIRPEEFRPH